MWSRGPKPPGLVKLPAVGSRDTGLLRLHDKRRGCILINRKDEKKKMKEKDPTARGR